MSYSNPIVRTLLRRGYDHPVNCEDDNAWIAIGNDYFLMVFDGCSSAFQSRFASTLLAKIMRAELVKFWQASLLVATGNTGPQSVKVRPNVTKAVLDNVLVSVKDTLQKLFKILNMRDLEIASTIVLLYVDTESRSGLGMIVGDGGICVNGKLNRLIAPDNTPDYIAYHVEKDTMPIVKYVAYDNIEDASVFTDGLDSYLCSTKNIEDYDAEVIKPLLVDKSIMASDAMLSRKANILEKKNLYNKDDLSIVRIILQP
jgi:hypothetical protein